MVHLYVFNPVRKIRFLSTLFYRGSKRLLGSIDHTSTVLAAKPLSKPSQFFNIAIQTPRPIGNAQLARDADFYYSEVDGSLCVFQVESTLFKVHRILLNREPSAFGDMFCLPQPEDETTGTDTRPIVLSDTVDQFKDFMWALYAPPTELFSESRIDRLLNILELANKYCFTSLESWLVQHIYKLAQDPKGSLRSSSSSLQTRILHLAVLCNHQKLQDLVTHNLICRVLWYNLRPETVIEVAEQHDLRKLLGVCYYRQLVQLECMSHACEPEGDMKTQFPEDMSVEERMRFLSAHDSLLSLWEHIRSAPPPFRLDGCPFHDTCEDTWQSIWYEALKVDEGLCSGSADVLGRLKSVMFCVRHLLSEAACMSMSCKQAALESFSTVRDEIIGGLMSHFEDIS